MNTKEMEIRLAPLLKKLQGDSGNYSTIDFSIGVHSDGEIECKFRAYRGDINFSADHETPEAAVGELLASENEKEIIQAQINAISSEIEHIESADGK